jgi:hypothetical protein
MYPFKLVKKEKVKMSYKSSLENAFLGASADFTAVDNTGSCNSIVVSVFSQLNSLIDCCPLKVKALVRVCLVRQ